MLNEKKPTVSIILPTYNRAHLVGRAIKSILDQTYQDFEIIVVDDGSRDNTEERINSFTDTRIIYVKHQQNKGGSAARNTGIKLAKGRYIAFQDSDDEWLPRKLELQIKAFEVASSEVGVIYTDMLKIKKNGEEEYWNSPTVEYGKIINLRTLNYQVADIGIQSTLIKRECFDRVGVFDERIPRYIDLDLFIRLLKNYHFYHIKEPLVKYWTTDGICSNSKTEPIARKLLLEKYSEETKQNREFVANQCLMIGCALQSTGKFIEGRNYVLRAFKTKPLSAKYLLFLTISLSGQKTFIRIRNIYRKLIN